MATTTGTMNKAQFVIATKVQPCTDHNPVAVNFDGTSYLVLWNDHSDCPSGPTWDILVCRLDASGSFQSTAFQVNPVTAKFAGITTLACNGNSYLATWTDGRNDANRNGSCDSGEGTCMDVYGQYISKTGSLVGGEFVINADVGNQVGLVTGFHDGKYLVLLDMGFTMTPTTPGGGVANDVYGVFVTP